MMTLKLGVHFPRGVSYIATEFMKLVCLEQTRDYSLKMQLGQVSPIILIRCRKYTLLASASYSEISAPRAASLSKSLQDFLRA